MRVGLACRTKDVNWNWFIVGKWQRKWDDKGLALKQDGMKKEKGYPPLRSYHRIPRIHDEYLHAEKFVAAAPPTAVSPFHAIPK